MYFFHIFYSKNLVTIQKDSNFANATEGYDKMNLEVSETVW